MSKKGNKQARIESPRPGEPDGPVQNPRATDEDSARKSNTRHKKVTADKWNQ